MEIADHCIVKLGVSTALVCFQYGNNLGYQFDGRPGFFSLTDTFRSKNLFKRYFTVGVNVKLLNSEQKICS